MATPADAEWVAATQRHLGRLDIPMSMKVRYTGDGAFLLAPLTFAHFENAHALVSWGRSIPGVRTAGKFTLLPAIDGYTPEPDFALIVGSACHPHRTAVNASDVRFIGEIVSTESEQRGYVRTNNHYATAGIPSYLVLDVLTAEWTLFTEPQDGTYTRTCTGPFGSAIPVTVDGEPHAIDSGQFEHL